jgi:hypothetical protein
VLEQLKNGSVVRRFQFEIFATAARGQCDVHSFRMQVTQQTLCTCW